MTGAEIAWRTLNMEQVDEPCIVASWIMKRDFFRHYAGVDDIYADPVRTVVDALANAGANLNPQFIMPSPGQEHIAISPEAIIRQRECPGSGKTEDRAPACSSIEDVRREFEALPAPDQYRLISTWTLRRTSMQGR